METAPLFDLHCHLDWFADAATVARDAARLSLSIFANTVTPDCFVRATNSLASCDNVIVGMGMHPWWVADGRIDAADVARAARLAYGHPFIGEIGLDFSNFHTSAESHEVQVGALAQVLAACDAGARARGMKLISLHAVRSANVVLDLLGQTGCLDSCHCVFHWFSGTSNELHRAVRAGCLFSVNEMMLRTRRGREYARQLPKDRLLTETDLPPGKNATLTAEDIAASVGRSCDMLGELHGCEMRGVVAGNASRLLGDRGMSYSDGASMRSSPVGDHT